MIWDLGFFQTGTFFPELILAFPPLLNVGLSLELGQIIGCNHVKIAIPALQAKFRIYDGNMTLPGVAVGYYGQGYFLIPGCEDNFLQRGLYIIVGQRVSY